MTKLQEKKKTTLKSYRLFTAGISAYNWWYNDDEAFI